MQRLGAGWAGFECLEVVGFVVLFRLLAGILIGIGGRHGFWGLYLVFGRPTC